MKPADRLRALRSHAALAFFVAAAWVLLFELNTFFTVFEASPYVSWVFLPAAMRMLAVLWLGWTGVAGLFLGALVTNDDLIQTDPAAAITLSALSSLPSLLAAKAVASLLRVPADLAGLRPAHLFVYGVAGAAASVVAHNAYFALRDESPAAFSAALPMFVGDVAGTMTVLLVMAAILRKMPGRKA